MITRITFAIILSMSSFSLLGAEETKTVEPSKDETTKEAAAPRLGKYLILSYGAVGKPPLTLGHLVLEEGGKYKVLLVGGKSGGEGTYTFDAEKKMVVWNDGPYKDVFGGEFSTDREGQTHKIRLKKTTIATHSLDAEKQQK